jgi:quercetin dioxygenase-like cupin family protein
MTTAVNQIRLNPSEEILPVGPLTIRFLVAGDVSKGSAAVFELTVPGAEKLMAPAHSHIAYEETIYGLSGVLSFTVEGQRFDIGPGQLLCIPRGAVHRFDNFGDDAAKVLCLVTPAALAPEYFREIGAVVNAAAGRPPDKAKMMEIMNRHGLKPALPASTPA